MTSSRNADTAPGSAIYSFPFVLRTFYDFWVLGISSTYLWRASTSRIQLPFFKKHLSSKHLDIGVGTGYYLANADLSKDDSVTLCDLNPDSLITAKNRIHQLEAKTIQQDIFEPLATDEKFSSISLMYIFHCLPGPPERKATVFRHLKKSLREEGVIFGSTVLGKGVVHNWAGRCLLWLYNSTGVFGNAQDSPDVFLKELKLNFRDVDARIEGRVLLFAARGPI